VTAEPILHHYPVSPFAEKIRAIFGYKKLAWRSVEIPMILPKPDVVALTGGYRRTPLLQIGADVYCDSALIARTLERIAPEPSIYPEGDTLAVQAAAHFADSVLFNIAIPVGFQPGGMLKLFLPDATPEFLKKFAEDRAAMRVGGTVRRGPLHECKANLAAVLARVEAQLRGAFLFGAKPTVADFALYHVLWSVHQPPIARPVLDPFPKTVALIERIAAFGHGKPSALSSEEALGISKKSKPAEIKNPQAFETDGIALGETAEVMPVDNALVPVRGELLHCSTDEIALRRTDPRAGTVIVHFPRFGYQVKRCQA
jgi:glutathione S-transferase